MRSLVEPSIAWLSDYKKASHQRFEAIGYPSKRSESWRYTSVRPLSTGQWGEACRGEVAFQSTIRSSAQLVFANGYLMSSHVAEECRDALTVMPFGKAGTDEQHHLLQLLENRSIAGDEPFVVLNASEFRDGVHVHVKAGVELSAPIEVVFVATEEARCHNRLVVTTGANSRASLVEHYISSRPELSYLTNTVTQIHLGSGAQLEHTRIQDESLASYHVGYTGVAQARDSSYVNHAFALGGKAARSEVQVRFEQPGASCSLNGLYVPTAGQNHDNYTLIDHATPHCTSAEYYKAVVSDNATGSFQGRVLIGAGAVGSSSDQLNRNLLLGNAAVANTKPQLEIDNDDVRATHGSTVGRIDDEAVFYLMTRGLTRADAKAFLVSAFAEEIIGRVGVESVRDNVRTLFGKRLTKVGAIA